MPEVSIVIPSYNSERYIKACLQSVRDQQFQDWEGIVVDDGSSDNSSALVQSFCDVDPRFRLIELQENQGPANARACAIAHSTGKYVAFLDSDDLWESEKLEMQLKWMKEGEIRFSCTSYGKIDKDGKDLDLVVNPPAVWDYQVLLRDCPGNSTVMVEGDLIRSLRIPDIKKRNDYLLWLQVIKRTGKLYGLKNVSAFHRVHDKGISSSKLSLIKYHWQIYKRHERLGGYVSAKLTAYWILKKGFIRFLMKRGIMGK